ncbi:MAG TPA: glycosyltransferase family 4 protein [Vicinamibacteria bacterium]|nr:glycosyltransferase family 4 protein [Vicinamibacteria bacterium]
MRPLQVATVAACPFPANRGTPSRIKGIAEAVAARGHRVAVVTYHFGLDVPTRGIEVRRIRRFPYRHLGPGPTLFKLGVLDPFLLAKLVGLLRRQRFDVIHAHQFEGALIAQVARRLTGVPVIYDAHTTLASELPAYRFPSPRRLSEFLDRQVPRAADHVIAVSDSLRDFLRAQGVPGEKIDVVPMGIEPSDFPVADAGAARAECGLPGGRLVMYAGSLDGFQRVDLLIESMQTVFQHAPDSALCLIVSWDRPEIRSLIDRLGLGGKVTVAVEPRFERVPRYLAASDVVVLPRTECSGVPQKLVNYMAAGRAIVSFEGSAKLLQHRRNGLVVPNGDTRAMAGAILELLRDEGLRSELAATARKDAIDHYDWAALAGRVEGIYRRTLDAHARGHDP